MRKYLAASLGREWDNDGLVADLVSDAGVNLLDALDLALGARNLKGTGVSEVFLGGAVHRPVVDVHRPG